MWHVLSAQLGKQKDLKETKLEKRVRVYLYMQESQAHNMPTSLKTCIFLLIPKLWRCLFQTILLVYLCVVYEYLPLLLPTFSLAQVFSLNQKLSFSDRLTDQ